MKAIFITLLLTLSPAFGLVAAGGAQADSTSAVDEVAELSTHPSLHEIEAHAEAVLEHAAAVAHADRNKLSMITDKFGVSWPTLIAQMINFCLVAFVLYKFAVKPIAATLDERRQKIADGLQYAEEMKTQLAEAERERAEKIKAASAAAQQLLTESREQAKEMIEQKTQEAAAQAEAIIRKAVEATELERQKMLADVRQEVARLVVATAAKVLAQDLSEAEKQTFSESAAQQLASTAR